MGESGEEVFLERELCKRGCRDYPEVVTGDVELCAESGDGNPVVVIHDQTNSLAFSSMMQPGV